MIWIMLSTAVMMCQVKSERTLSSRLQFDKDAKEKLKTRIRLSNTSVAHFTIFDILTEISSGPVALFTEPYVILSDINY